MGKNKTEKKLSHLDKTRINAYSFIEVAEFAKAEKAALAAMKESDKEQAATEALLAMAQRGLGKLASAEEHAENAMKLAPEKADIVFVNALCKWSSGDYEEAKKLFEKSLELAPERWDMRLDYAGFLLHQQKFDECLIQTEKVEAVNPEHPKAKILRTCAFHENWQSSVDTLAFKPPIPLPEGQIETYLSIGRAHLRNDYYDLAMEEFSRALDIDNSSNEAKSLYAAAFHFKNDAFSGWCKNFRRQVRSPLYAIITLIPFLAASALGAYMQLHSTMTNAIICYAIAVTYGMTLFALYLRGYVTKTPQDFAFIIAQNGLTPQGRINSSDRIIDELDEIKFIKKTPTEPKPGNKAKVGDDQARVIGQLDDISSRLKTSSMTFAAIAFLAFIVVMWPALLDIMPEIHTSETFEVIQRVAGGVMILFAFLAILTRHKANSINKRL